MYFSTYCIPMDTNCALLVDLSLYSEEVDFIQLIGYSRATGSRGRDCIVVGFTTAYASRAYHH